MNFRITILCRCHFNWHEHFPKLNAKTVKILLRINRLSVHVDVTIYYLGFFIFGACDVCLCVGVCVCVGVWGYVLVRWCVRGNRWLYLGEMNWMSSHMVIVSIGTKRVREMGAGEACRYDCDEISRAITIDLKKKKTAPPNDVRLNFVGFIQQFCRIHSEICWLIRIGLHSKIIGRL